MVDKHSRIWVNYTIPKPPKGWKYAGRGQVPIGAKWLSPEDTRWVGPGINRPLAPKHYAIRSEVDSVNPYQMPVESLEKSPRPYRLSPLGTDGWQVLLLCLAAVVLLIVVFWGIRNN